VRLQFAARFARAFVFSLGFQIHICFDFSAPIIPSDVRANFARNSREREAVAAPL
jgi:hypothetical protein